MTTTKRTHKLRGLGNVAAVVQASPSRAAAARTLGVDRSTLHRWITAGKVPAPGVAPRRPRDGSGARGRAGVRTPEAWARSVRARYALSPEEAQLLEAATIARTMLADPARDDRIRLAAAAEFRRLLAALQLPIEEEDTTHGETEAADGRCWPRAVR